MKNTWQPSFNKQNFEIVTETTGYDGRIIKILERRVRFKMFDGNWSPVINRLCMTRNSAAVVLLYQPEHDVVVMVEQFRSASIDCSDSPWLLEPVAGIIEGDYSAADTATKEAQEEAGCEILELIPIGKYLASPGISNEVTHVFCGRIKDYQPGSVHGLPLEHENIKVHTLPVEEAFALLATGELLAVASIVSLQWLQIHRAKLRQRWDL